MSAGSDGVETAALITRQSRRQCKRECARAGGRQSSVPERCTAFFDGLLMNLRRFVFFPLLGVLFAALFAVAPPAWGQTNPAVEPPPEKVDQLINLLADPAVKEWLTKQVQAVNPPAAAPADPQPSASGGGMERSMVSSALDRIKDRKSVV